MKSDENMSIDLKSEAALINLAQKIGSKLRGGEVIELIGDIGSGKTTFVRGIAQGIGIEQSVTSPTFVVQQKYEGSLNIYHYDFYRLDDGGLLSHEFEETLEDEKSVVIVEWAQTIKEILPVSRVRIKFTATGEETRSLDIYIPKSLRYLRDAYTDYQNQ